MTALESSARELTFTTKALSYDSKNYHTWAYRQWVLCHFFSASVAPSLAPSPSPKASSTAVQDFAATSDVWKGEIAYAESLLDEDIRNNSAWNHRFFVAFESGMGGKAEDIITREMR